MAQKRTQYVKTTSGLEKQLIASSADIVEINTIEGLDASNVQDALEKIKDIADNGGVTGVKGSNESSYRKVASIAQEESDKILPYCRKYVHPSAIYEDGKMIIKVEVNKVNSLYYIKKYGRSASGCYVKIVTTCKSMSEEEIEKGFIKTLKIVEESIIDKRCVRQKLSFSALKTLLISNGQHINEDSFDETYSLLNGNGEYNYYAGLIEDNADVSIKVATFKGKDKTTF